MSQKIFTPEEIAILRANPYVVSVTPLMIRFTEEFKERFYEEYESGKTPSAIITGMGIDPQMLGQGRIIGIRFHIMEQAKRPERFSGKRANKPRSISGNRNTTTAHKIKELEHQLAYTRQEVEFLKKIILANREAEREWELKRRHQKSSGLSEK